MKREFSPKYFRKNTQIRNFTEIRQVGAAESFHTDGRTDGRTDRQTDMTQLTVAFRNFVNAPKKEP